MKKRNIVHSALSLSLTAALCLSMAACGGTQTPADSAAASQPAAPSAAVQPSSAEQASAALPVKALNPKQVEENPYMAKSDANIHHDGYNTDSTDEILPLAIYPEINVSYETTNANASPAIYFDSYGHADVPLLGGIAIRDHLTLSLRPSSAAAVPFGKTQCLLPSFLLMKARCHVPAKAFRLARLNVNRRAAMKPLSKRHVKS